MRVSMLRRWSWLWLMTLAACGSGEQARPSSEPGDAGSLGTFESDVPGPEATRGAPSGVPTGSLGGGAGMGQPGSEASSSDAQRAIVEADIVQLSGDRLHAMSRIAGLSIIDVSEPAEPRLLGRYRGVSGEPFEIYLRGDVVLVLFSGWGEYVARADGYAFVETSKLIALDAHDPAQIELIGSFDIPGAVSDSRIVGDVLYVVGYENGSCWGCAAQTRRTTVVSLDVKDPRNLHKADELSFADIDTSWGRSRRSVTVTDQRLYAAGPELGANGPVGSSIQVVDISDPAGSMLEGAVVQAEGQIASRWQMDEYDGVLRVISQPDPGRAQTDPPVVQTYRVASAAQITPLGRSALVLPDAREVLQSARFDGPRAYAITADRRDPLFVIDLSDPAAPRQRGALEMPGFVYHMVPQGERVIGLGLEFGNAEGPITVSVFDVANMDEPRQLSRVNFGGTWAQLPEDQDRIHKAFRILPELGLVLVPFSGWSSGSEGEARCDTPYRSGVQLVGLAGDALHLLGAAPSSGTPRRAFVHRGHLFTVSDSHVDVFGIQDRAAPAAVSSLSMARFVRRVVPLDGDIVARFNTGYFGGVPWVDFVRAGDADAPQTSLGRVDLGETLGVQDTCQPFGAVQAAFGRGTQLEMLYQRGANAAIAGLLVVDASDPAQPSITSKLEWKLDQDAAYHWFDGPTDFVDDKPLRPSVARLDQALVILEEASVWSNVGHTNKARLRVIDLRDLQAPKTALIALPFGGKFYSGLVASGDEILLAYYEAGLLGQGRARFFAQPLLLSDLDQPRLGEPVSIPGALLHFDAASGRIVTSQLTRVDAAHLTPEACDERFGFYRLEPTQTSDKRCTGYRQTLQLVKLSEDSAVIEDSLPIDEARMVTSSSLGEDRVFAVLNSDDYPYAAAAGACGVACVVPALGREPVELLVFSGLDSGRLQHGRLQIEAFHDPSRDFGPMPPVHAHGQRALLGSLDGVSVLDAADVSRPALVHSEALLGNLHEVVFAGDSAFLALGEAGVQRVALPERE